MTKWKAIVPCVLGLLAACSSEQAKEWRGVGAATVQSPIIAGEPDTATAHDAVVLLINTTDDSLCTGVVVSRKGEPAMVLTARHCVTAVKALVSCDGTDLQYDYHPANIAVLRGAAPDSPNAGFLGSGKKVFYQEADSTGMCNNDFAIVQLDKPNDSIEPFRLRTMGNRIQVGQTFDVLGYGARKYPDPGAETVGLRYIRQGVQVTAVGPLAPDLFDREFFGTEGICVGDSGGPAVSGDTVIGIASRVDNCYGGTGLWMRPESFVDLIDASFREACASFVDEEGVVRPADPAPGCPGGDAGGAGSGGSAGGGGSAGTGASAGTGGEAGSPGVAGQDPGSSGSAGVAGAPGSPADFQGEDDSGCAATVAGSQCASPAGVSLWLAALAVLLGLVGRRSRRW